ncbi:hemolysin XhlA family protein [uncultured Brevibacillus sp.]|uniref:hemolysin XhlA family protein n=1 Tax=unclassified Brevibacillus TaxID=2684853 RepID=UPI002593F50A|nr:hemolysin XhlA family protein [uncultured Brevibacillus sp.]
MDEQTRMLSDIRERVVRVETKIDSMTDVQTIAEKAKDTANEALQYGKSAHKRLDEIKDNQKWLWRTVIGAVITGAIALFWKGVS